MNDDLYQVLGVDREATLAQIKAAYRHIVKTAHPDAGGDPDEFVRITAAYNVLEDPDTRKAYDLSGEYGDENALHAQARVIEHIVSMFEEIWLQADGQIADFDVISAMKAHMAGLARKFAKSERELAVKLELLHKMNREIKRRGEAANMFSSRIEKRISDLSAEYSAVKISTRDIRRVREELDRAGTVVQVIRTVQAGAYSAPSSGGIWDFFRPNITTT